MPGSSGRLAAPRVVTDYNNEPVCVLPKGFFLDDRRWQTIWARYETTGEALSHNDLAEMFPDETSLQAPAIR